MYCEIIGTQDEIKDGVMVQRYDIQEEIYYQKPREDEEEVDDDDDELVASNENITSLDMENTAPTEESEPELDPDIDWSMKKVIFKELCDYFAELADVVSKDGDKCSNIKKWIREQLVETPEKGSGIEAEINKSDQGNEAIKISNPPQASAKGSPCTNRLKSKQYKIKVTKENVNTTKEISNQQNIAGAFQSLGGAEISNLHRGEYNQLLQLAELQRVGNIGNATMQFPTP
ncbi:hypothetical protein C5167_003358 [Papaver somniferum]|uniref:Uncharacterized protein n=1 Tax=Papaver somniferum TaxID=3469 RepID=A0A4Y7L0G8_PAPSO|nr:hypothetical protein C5167_003358 [Papaver somniferum]